MPCALARNSSPLLVRFYDGDEVIRWLGPLGRVWASAIMPLTYFVFCMAVSLGFCTLIHLHYILWLIVRIIVCFYICGCDAQFVILSFLLNSGLPSGASVSVLVSRKTVLRGGGTPATFGFEAEAAQLPSRTNTPPPPPLSPSPTRRDNAELQFGGEMVQQMATTSFHAEGRRLKHQEELSKCWRVTTRSKTIGGRDSRRPIMVTSLVVFWFGFGECNAENDSSACAVVHTDSHCCL